jgi:phage shock protein PspC (stress-responsive transcriptional regulator)
MTNSTVAPYRQLRRPHDDRIIAGVCSGVGRYFGVDPVLVRVAFTLAILLTWGTAALAYPVMWFLMPEEPRPVTPVFPDPAADPLWTPPTPPAA